MLKRLKNIGPGAMVAAAFIGPGTVTTATIAGSSYGYTLLWAVLFATISTIILQEMAARLGTVGGLGIGESIRLKIKQPVLLMLVSGLVIGAIFVGNAAYEAGNIAGAVLGFDLKTQFDLPFNPLVFLIGGLAFCLLYTGKYRLIEKTLVVLVSIMGTVFLVSAFLLKPNIGLILQSLFIPKIPDGSGLMIVGLIGTTVVPYNLFLHASTSKNRWIGENGLSNARWDTILSVTLGGIITMAIVITSATAFGGSDIQFSSAADLAVQLEPILGQWSKSFLGFGFLAAGLSSAITAPLAAAYATSEILNWDSGLKNPKFKSVWIVIILIGMLFSCLNYKPTTIILFAQIANGLLLPIIAGFLLWVMNDRTIMKGNRNSMMINILGFIVILITLMLGLKGIFKALNFI